MIGLMIATPALTVQTGQIHKGTLEEAELEQFEFLTTSSTTPDCDLTGVTVTEVFTDTDDWFELYNSGSQECDLGG